MTVDEIKNGIVIDHITAGKGMRIYKLLGLDSLECSVALIKNAPSGKMGKKDIIKVAQVIDLDFTIIQKKELNIFGSRNALTRDFEELIDTVKAQNLKLDDVVL